MEADIMKYGGGPNVSDAFTINGLPGPLYPCSTKGEKSFYFIKFVISSETQKIF